MEQDEKLTEEEEFNDKELRLETEEMGIFESGTKGMECGAHQFQTELDKCPNNYVSVLQWENFLDKYFREMPPGFTKFTKFYSFKACCIQVIMKKLRQ